MEQLTPSISEIKVEKITFQVVSHFPEEGQEQIDSKLKKLMEQEIQNRMIKPNSS